MLFNCFIIALIFGVTPIFEKHILSFIRTDSYIILNGFLVFLLSIFYYLFLYNHNILDEIIILNKNREVVALMILTVCLVYLLGNYLFFHTISLHKTHVVTALVATYPIITLLIAYLFLNEDITFYHSLGVFFIVGGVVLINI